MSNIDRVAEISERLSDRYRGTATLWSEDDIIYLLARLTALEAETQALRDQIAGYKHEAALIDVDTQRGITDCSTPLFQRVRNIVEMLFQAEQRAEQAEASRDSVMRLNKQIQEFISVNGEHVPSYLLKLLSDLDWTLDKAK